MYIQRTTMRRIIRFTIMGALLMGLSSCINDHYDDMAEYADRGAAAMVGVSLNIQARAMSNIQSSSEEEYVEGTQWENYINMYAGDYRIYFFTYDPQAETGSGSGANSTLISEFKPADIYSTDAGVYTTYTLLGEIEAELMESNTDFKVLVAANWGVDNYPTDLTPGVTTIDEICNAGTFSAFVDNTGYTPVAAIPSYSTNHIPFFGLREYSNVTWKEGARTRLDGNITMLRAVAKVEVIVTEGSTVQSFDDVSIVNYNAQGYCAPAGVYLKGDYDHDGVWADDFIDALHLVNNGANDTDQDEHTFSLQQTTNADGQETWVGYLTEYDNMVDTDYSYINVTIGDDVYPVYFGNYTNGHTTAYGDNEADDMPDRFDIYRNYLYRFYVTKTAGEAGVTVSVSVVHWESLEGEDITL